MVNARLIFQTTESGVIKSYIWTFVNRFLHYFLILTFALAYLCADIDAWIYFHCVFGILFGVGVLLRIIWGFVGTKHSVFWDFNFRGILEYLRSIFGEKRHYVGHNPASSLAIVLMFALGLGIMLSGMLQYGAQEQGGIFDYLFFEYNHFEAFEDLHAVCAHALLAVIIVHICGSLIDKLINKNDALDSMISGYKQTGREESVALNCAQKILFAMYLVVLFVLLVYLLFPNNVFLRPSMRNIFAQETNLKEYTKECGSCHIAYAPYLLPKSAWDSMMSDLENHFGEDAILEQESHAVILAFLNRYSSDVVKTKISSKVAKEPNPKPLAITKYPYWEAAHRAIDPALFETQAIKSRANCQTCHEDAESGIFAKGAIHYFKLKNLKENL